jgi:hypothetical protein
LKGKESLRDHHCKHNAERHMINGSCEDCPRMR